MDNTTTMDHAEFTARRSLPMMALRGLTVFPGMMLTFEVERSMSIAALNMAMSDDQIIYLVPQKDIATDIPTPDDVYGVGTVCRIKQMMKLGGLGNIMNMLPGLGGMGMGKMKGLGDEQMDEAEKGMARMEAMIHSMTPAERRDPDLLNPSRKHRIAKGAGVDISEVNRMIKQFNEAKKMMKTFAKPGKKGKFKLPF